LVLKARLVIKALKAHRVFRALLAQLDCKENRVLKAPLVFKENRVYKALKER
jgi:hypothetical protein